MIAPDPSDAHRLDCDVLVVGGGTAGTMAALTAAEKGASVLLLEKAHVRHSGALAMGMDGVNNAVVPGKADPEDYVAEITRANDGVVDQRTVHQTATRGFAMVQRLERYGVKFEKDEYGEYDVRRVHRSGSYVLPMPEGKDVKKVLYRQLRRREVRERVRIENRFMPVRVLTEGGRAVGAAAFDTRSGDFVTVGAKAVVLATGACGRLGLPASGYLYGTYENPTNAGDGYAMAYHAGAELSGIECFQINPLIKDYNGPACAYVANPFGGYQVNGRGERFVDSDYWSGQMIAEVARETASERGPVYLKVSHLPEETIGALEGILHTTERPTRGTFHAGRGHDYRTHDVEMHVSEIGLCGGHSASGVWVDDNGATSVPGLYAAGDLACVPHNYMLGAFVFGDLAGAHAAGSAPHVPAPEALPEEQVRAAHELIYRPLRNPDGPPQPQVEYKLRRFVNDYVAPPKTGSRLRIALEHFERMRDDLAAMGAGTPHELMRAAEVSFIRDCAEMAARASLTRTESRWGLYHERTDLPERDDEQWLYHLNLYRDGDGEMAFVKRPVAPYLVPVPEFEARLPAGGPVPVEPDEARAPVPREPAPPPAAPDERPEREAPPRVVELLAQAEDLPSVAELGPYLHDPDPTVRTTAVSVLTESVPPGTGEALAEVLTDADPRPRRAAVAALRELVEVLDPELGRGLRAHVESPDAVVRAGTLDLLRALRAGPAEVFTEALHDADPRVRIEAVRGLVSLDRTDHLAPAAGDRSREVRVAVAEGLGTIAAGTATTGTPRVGAGPVGLTTADGGSAGPATAGTAPKASADRGAPGTDTTGFDPAGTAASGAASASTTPADPGATGHAAPRSSRATHVSQAPQALRALRALRVDPDPLVRAAALAAFASYDQGPEDVRAAGEALSDSAWQVRKGAARGLVGASPEEAVPLLERAAGDVHQDVRKAAVLSLAPWSGRPEAAAVLRTVVDDPDADVRAHARHALDHPVPV
ncbi:fumarate reductase/succinate dehydrogenase flavoprotein subunit [Nocardiopsis sp. HNM0947]|uniref:Fumarate reductase/succinate dehydrogenase flavoprotein subunit n=1 Tax=Nocardiopsis coralli TaxID=2772213 RepID=A0ABR9PE70_9ACTN|nr:fumarate reductase/succinate dehydrogenase flavoprotein subunit [Nocardiopsis coralli]MBE3002109.1 fumarate reductase/succinate dehydrogenase flavoprotein subunit [Nocardiopsis coralli]